MGLGLIPDLVTSWLDHKAQKKGAKQVIGQYNDYQTGATNALNTARDTAMAGYQPFLQGGQNQFQAAQNMLTPGFQYEPTDPAYAFRRGEMENALARKGAASGSYNSGGYDKALARYIGDLSNTYFQQDFGNRNQLAQYGLQAAQGGAQVQSGYGREISDVMLKAAEGRSAGYLGKANAKSQLYGDISGAFEDAAQNVAHLFGF